MINLDLHSIPESEQENVLSIYWQLLGECEALADNENDAMLQRLVEGAFRQWNVVTGQDHVPRWISRKK